MPVELAEDFRKMAVEEDEDFGDRQMMLDYFGTTDKVKIRLDILDDLKAHGEYSYNEALFPYKAEGPLETPLPTVHEIYAAVTALNYCAGREDAGSLHVRIGPYFIKAGLKGAVLREAENMIYLEKHSDIRIPKVYAAFSSRDVDLYNLNEEGGPPLYHYLIQELMEGVPLEDLLDDLNLPQNRKVARKLGEMMAKQMGQLRNTPPEDPNHFGRVNGQPLVTVSPSFIFPDDRNCPNYGPFMYEGLVERIIHCGKIWLGMAIDVKFIHLEMVRNARGPLLAHTTPDDRLPVLSHLDIHNENIIVKVTRSEEPGEEQTILDIEEVVFIDWETLAWMPGWYEAAWISHIGGLSRNRVWAQFAVGSLEDIGHIKILPFTYYRSCLSTAAFP